MEKKQKKASETKMLHIIHSKSEDFERRFKKIVNRGDRPLDNIEQTVRETLDDVRERGDAALLDLTKRYDEVTFNSVAEMRVPLELIDSGGAEDIDPAFLKAFRKAKDKIIRFHEKQKTNSWISMEEHGVILGQRKIPMKRVGVYVPGGPTTYPSSILMNTIPAQLAGVQEFYLVTPPIAYEDSPNPYLLAAAKELNIKNIFRVGGAQAIGALAFGTETIPRVDKIVGPGDVYVSLAKKLVQGFVGTDMVLAPSEVVILADETAYPKTVAADLLSQAEKDEMSSTILITTSKELAEYVVLEVEIQCKTLSRNRIIQRSLEEYGAIIVVDTLTEGIDLANQIAPEHLGIITKDAWQLLDQIENAGAVFVGPYSPEAVGDYLAGPNHVLPTGGMARFLSPLGVNDFLKSSNIIFYTAKALKQDQADLVSLTTAEGFDAHCNAVKQRFLI